MRRYLVVSVVVVLGCEKKSTEPRYEGPMPVTFGDCAPPATAWVSGPRPAPFTPAQAADVWLENGVVAQAPKPAAETPPTAADPGPAAVDEGKMGKRDPQIARQQAIDAARASGVIGSTALIQSGAFASLTANGDLSSGFDDSDIYGGLLGSPDDELNSGYGNGGYGLGFSGIGPQNGGTGWGTIGTIGTGRYGTIGTKSGYGVGGRYGGMRTGNSASIPSVSIGQPTTQGDLDKAIIRRYVKRNIQKITYCYEKALLAKPALSGTVSTQFFITGNGNVASSTASGVDPEVARCVAGVIKDIQFPEPKGGGGVQVNYPFTFLPAGNAAGARAGSGSATADAPGSGAAVGGGSGSAAPAEREVSSTATRRLFRRPGDAIDAKYQPGAMNPLRADEKALTECFRKGARHYGTAAIELAYDGAGKVTAATVHGVDDKLVVACVTKTIQRVKRTTSAVTAERCSLAFGEMRVPMLPALDVKDDAVLHDAKVLAAGSGVTGRAFDPTIPEVVDLVKARLKETTAQSAPVVTMHGPLVVRAIGTAKMKLVNRVLGSVLAGGDDFVLAVQKGAEWELVTPLALPVVPVPFGTGTVWNHVRLQTRHASADPGAGRTTLSVLVEPDRTWIGASEGGESVEIKRDGQTAATLRTTLEKFRATAALKGRTDIEIAAGNDVTYADFVSVVRTAVDVGFIDWQLTDSAALSVHPAKEPR